MVTKNHTIVPIFVTISSMLYYCNFYSHFFALKILIGQNIVLSLQRITTVTASKVQKNDRIGKSWKRQKPQKSKRI